MKKWLSWLLLIFTLSACQLNPTPQTEVTPTATLPPATSTPQIPAASPTAILPEVSPTAAPAVGTPTPPPATPVPSPTPALSKSGIPVFDHILVIWFENRSFAQVIGNASLPEFNRLASQNVLLTDYHAVTHPSLPNYIALAGGQTFGITTDCTTCWVDGANLADRIEAGGRTWKTYQEDLPSPCFVGSAGKYAQKHDPFIYFNDIRTDPARCQQSIVPLTQLDADLAANRLPNFAFIMPNLCNSAHDCSLEVADHWLGQMIQKLQGSAALGQHYLIAITFDESAGDNSSCCGLPASAGGRVAAILISPEAKSAFQDATPYSHYSLLKTILLAWDLPALGHTADSATQAITDAWK